MKALSELRTASARLEDRKDAASLASRHAIALTLSYLGDLTSGAGPGAGPGRKQQKALAEVWAEAASKVRRIDQRLDREFQSFSDFWAAGARDSFDVGRTVEYVQHLLELLRQKNMRVVD